MSERPTCPACGSDRTLEIYRLAAIPVQSCVLLARREDALRFPQRGLVLAFCDDCGFVFNAIFDPSAIDYAAATEESQHFSGTFNRFAETLVEEIVTRYELRGRRTLEVGCGKGDFLHALVRASGTCGLGVDPGVVPERLKLDGDERLDFRREYFAPERIQERPDLIVCRHTLEHVADVRRFVEGVASLARDAATVPTFFETPDVARVLAEGAFWDIYYEHCSYFTLGSHARLFRRAGFDVTELYLAFDAQYIIQHADSARGGVPLAVEHDLERVRFLAETFPRRVAMVRERWVDFVRRRHDAGRRIAIWGGGSKGVSFITTNGLSDAITHVVDINPHKQGKYLPASGHRVIAPEAMLDEPPETVIAMNPIYVSEIREHLRMLGLSPELVAV